LLGSFLDLFWNQTATIRWNDLFDSEYSQYVLRFGGSHRSPESSQYSMNLVL
jgi:hypothetical protein